MTAPPPTVVIGCGLIGTSVALALTREGSAVYLDDADASHVQVAVERGAGIPLQDAPGAVDPALIVVAVPPSAVAAAVRAALVAWPTATVTDVASVKAGIAADLARSEGAGRYVGSHPMAGSERSGPAAASDRLFEGRPWVITPALDADDAAVRRVEELTVMLGSVPIVMDAATHDRAVALVSHVPQLVSTLTAARLIDAPSSHVALAGQGLRDVTRIAGSDPRLWLDILGANAAAVVEVLQAVRCDLDDVLAALAGTAEERSVRLASLLSRGREGTNRIPGKHGGERPVVAAVLVQVPDEPGALSKLFAAVGESGVNIEDLRIDHELGRAVGVVDIDVIATDADRLVDHLLAGGWTAYR